MFLKIFFLNFFPYVYKCLKIYQLNIIKKKKRLQKKVRKRYQGERYKKLSEVKKQKLVEYRKKYYRMRKNALSKL